MNNTTLEPVLPHPQLAVLLAACQLTHRGEAVEIGPIAYMCGIGLAETREALNELKTSGYLTLRPAWRVRLVKEKTA